MNRIAYSGDMGSLKDADFVIEAANEDFEIKKIIFQGLANTTPDHAILASNTSSISISKIGGVIPYRAHQVIGMHFMNPVPTPLISTLLSFVAHRLQPFRWRDSSQSDSLKIATH